MTLADIEFSALSILLAQIVVVLLVSRALAVAVQRAGQPVVIAEVLAGIVLGPSILGRLWPEAESWLFPASSMPILKAFSHVGLVLFMFLVGLELDFKVLRGRAAASVVISFASIVLPFALGVCMGAWLYPSYSAATVPMTSFLLFFGVALSVTAFPVLARILSEKGLTRSRIGVIALACAAVDDVSAWCILAAVVAVARSEGLSSAIRTLALTLVFVAIMVVVARPLLRLMGERIVRQGNLAPTSYAVTFALLLVSSWVSEVIGIHALFGAFLFGAVMPRQHIWTHTLAERLATVAVVMLLPLFFAYSGLRTEIGVISHASDWGMVAAVIACATLGKFGGSAIAARLTGLKWRDATAIGVLMNTRGLMELIVLNIGMDLGIISANVFTMLVIMAVATTAATTPVLNWVYPESELSAAHPHLESRMAG